MDRTTMISPLRGSTQERAWDTDTLPEPERFPFWQELVSDAFVPVSTTCREPGAFSGSVTARTVGVLGVSRIAAHAQSVARTPSHIERRAGDVFFLNLPLSEGTSASQDGRTASLTRGDFVIVDSTRPFELEFEREFRQLSFTLPHDSLAPLLAAPRESTAVRVPGDRGVGAVAAGALRALANVSRPFDRQAARALSEQVAGLVALALGGVQSPPSSTTRALLFEAALDEVERALDDPELSPGCVARRLGISTRYLHKLFAERGPSFGRWVLAQRLARCRRDLADPTRAHWTVTELSCHHGFADPSYFARAFKARYGVSPREFRRGLAAAPTSGAIPSR